MDVESAVNLDSDVDLECPVMHESTSWVEVASGDSVDVNTDKAGLTWADKVSNVALPLSEPLRDNGTPAMGTVNWDKSIVTAPSMMATSTTTTSTVIGNVTVMPSNSGGGGFVVLLQGPIPQP